MRLMNVMPSMASYRPQLMTHPTKAPVRMSGAGDAVTLQPFELEGDLVEQLKTTWDKPVYRQLGDDYVLSINGQGPEVAGKYSLRASIVGIRPGSLHQILTLSPESDYSNAFTVTRAKDEITGDEAKGPQRHQHVPLLLQILKEGREADKFDFMDVVDRYD